MDDSHKGGRASLGRPELGLGDGSTAKVWDGSTAKVWDGSTVMALLNGLARGALLGVPASLLVILGMNPFAAFLLAMIALTVWIQRDLSR